MLALRNYANVGERKKVKNNTGEHVVRILFDSVSLLGEFYHFRKYYGQNYG